MDSIEAYVGAGIDNALARVSPEEAADAYVVSLFVYDEDDDPLRPTVAIGFNTETQVAAETDSAQDADEARWNYAFWLQNELVILFDSRTDPDGAATRDLWIRDEELVGDETDPACVTRRFVEVLEHVVRGLHDDGVIIRRLGRPVPVLIHELEYYDEIAKQNQRANPEGLADPFAAWIASM